MRLGHLISLLAHIGLIVAFTRAAPDLLRTPDQTQFVPFELIDEAEIAERTNVPDEPDDAPPASAPEPAVEPEEEAPEILPPAEEETPAPAPTEEAETAPPVDAVPPPDAEAESEDNPIEPEQIEPFEPRVKPKREKDPLDFDALSALIDKEKQSEERAAPRSAPRSAPDADPADAAGEAVGVRGRLSATEKDLIRARIYGCWNTRAIIGAPEPEKLVVLVRIELTEEGELAAEPEVVNRLDIEISGNPFWRAAAREAVAAVIECAPYDYLPPEKYEQWRDLELNFDPRDMLGL